MAVLVDKANDGRCCLQYRNRDRHDRYRGLGQSPDREVNAFIREVGIGHRDGHHGLDNGGRSSAVSCQ
jgi:hypothetical protein